MHSALYFGIGINALVGAAAFFQSSIVGVVLCVAWGLCLVGVALVDGAQRKLGARLVQYASIAFLPLGLVALYGAKVTLDRIALAEFAGTEAS